NENKDRKTTVTFCRAERTDEAGCARPRAAAEPDPGYGRRQEERRMPLVDGNVGGAGARLPRPGRFLFVALGVVVGAFGCRKDVPDGENSTAALTVPVPTVTQFAVLASRTVSIGDRSSVVGGDLGVAAGATNSMTTGSDSRVGVGEVLLAPVMTLRDRTNAGEIGATTINVGVNVVTGPRSAYVAPPAAPVPGTFTPG